MSPSRRPPSDRATFDGHFLSRHTKKSCVNLFDGLQPLTPPRFVGLQADVGVGGEP